MLKPEGDKKPVNVEQPKDEEKPEENFRNKFSKIFSRFIRFIKCIKIFVRLFNHQSCSQ